MLFSWCCNVYTAVGERIPWIRLARGSSNFDNEGGSNRSSQMFRGCAIRCSGEQLLASSASSPSKDVSAVYLPSSFIPQQNTSTPAAHTLTASSSTRVRPSDHRQWGTPCMHVSGSIAARQSPSSQARPRYAVMQKRSRTAGGRFAPGVCDRRDSTTPQVAL
ncbi:hypothetical protein FKP32DRAFT_349141 [Trametes sanguinea]|nr:hypothetical protein FKP32DRAFT_349141 [Trametes sanguinea]